MGIPQLRRHLEPFANRAVLGPGDLVLDGPALAYHVLNLCWGPARKTSPFGQPSYELLGKTAVAWLDQAQACGLSVAAIYFDSYLPCSKREERIQRLVRSSRMLIKYHSAYLSGVPQAKPHDAGKVGVDLFPVAAGPVGKVSPPPPPFLVPAVIDALRASRNFGSLVKLVPGEADGFCARHVREHGGTVLTSDSDLLVYDLGETGGVVFFTDIDLDRAAQRFMALQYRPADLCRRLSIASETGLQRLAYEVSRDSHLTLEQAVQKSREGRETSPSRGGYARFIQEYLFPEVVPGLANQVSALDPRVSEIILQSLQVPGVVVPGSEDDVGSDVGVTMFLPFLLDCPARTSAWESSTSVRQLAYAVLRSVQAGDMPAVFEMRRLQTKSSGLRVAVPEPGDANVLGASLLTLLSNIQARLERQELVWVVLAIYQDITMTVHRGRGQPLSLEVLSQQAQGLPISGSWDFLHLLAEAQASYYSLRMLGQILDFASQRTGAASHTMSGLADLLSRLPPLSESPTVATFEETLRVLREPANLLCLEGLCVDYDGVARLINNIRNPRRSKKSNKRQRMLPGEEASIPPTSNPFDVLTRGVDV